MKLAEALAERAALQKTIENTKRRLLRNAAVREGDAPAEDPQTLLLELYNAHERLLTLIQRINRTNMTAQLSDGQLLMDALAARDTQKARDKILQDLVDAATERQTSYAACGHVVPTVNVSEIQKQADDYAKKYRILDCQIQEVNWNTQLAY